MRIFDPLTDIENAGAILDANGEWPNFHDAIINEVHYDRGDIRPDDDVWQGAMVEVAFTLDAYEEPYDVRLRFHDCDKLKLGVDGLFYPQGIYELRFTLEDRGTFADGVTPLPPWICAVFEEGAGIDMRIKCFRVVAERWPGPHRRY